MIQSMHLCSLSTVKTLVNRFSRLTVPLGRHVRNLTTNNADIDIRICQTHEKFDECVRLQQKVWQFKELDAVSRRVFHVTSSTGGVVLGAYKSHNGQSSLVGLLWSIVGRRPDTKTGLYFHSEMLAVHPDARNQYIARRLLTAMFNYALSQGTNLITGYFDVTNSELPYKYINRLGGIGRRYLPDFYGKSSSPTHGELPTDRIEAEWWIDSPHALRRFQSYDDHLSFEEDIIEEVYLPGELAEWRRLGDPRAAETLNYIRTKFTSAFDRNLVILDFCRKPDGGGVYQMGLFPGQQKLIKKSVTDGQLSQK